MATAQELVKISYDRIGVKENPPNSNSVDANDWFYGRRVQGPAYPWCCTSICYRFHLANADNLVKHTASCSDMYNWFKAKGRIYSTPKVGDLVFFKFDKTLSCIAQHIGLVVEVLSNGKIKSIEGNTSSGNSGSQDNGGMVALRTRSASQIVGYGRPAYSDSPKPKEHRPTIKEGDRGQDVKDLQDELRNKYKYGCRNDGYFDSLTAQCVQHYQATHALEIDGVVGKNTWQSLGMYYY